MKSKIPPFDELIDRLITQVQKRYSKKGSKIKYEDSYFFTQKTFVVPN